VITYLGDDGVQHKLNIHVQSVTNSQRQHVQVTEKKLQMIKSLRSLTRLMGKLGFKKFARESYVASGVMPRPPSMGTWYGLGLKEAKDFTENYISRSETKS